MKNINKIIVLGGGPDQVSLIQKLRQKYINAFIYLVDYAINPIAKHLVDEHVCISTLDNNAVADFAKLHSVDLVIVTSNDPAIQVMADVSERLNLPCYITYEQTLWLTDKMRMKDLMRENDIPTAKYVVVHSVDNINTEGLAYPLIVKPSDGCYGSKGVCKVSAEHELLPRVKDALEFSRTPSAIIEEFLDGIEISIDAYVVNNVPKILMVSQLKKFSENQVTSTIYQSVIPAPISPDLYKEIDIIAKKISNVFKLNNSPLLIQAMVHENNINVIELTARIGGGAKYITIPKVTGFDILNANIDSMFNITPSINLKPTKSVFSRCQLYTNEGVFDHTEGFEKLLEKGIVDSVIFNGKKPGDVLHSAKGNTNRFASIFIVSDSYESLNRKVKEAINNIKIIDVQGNNLLDKSMYE